MTGGEGYQEAQIPKDMSAFSEEFEKWKDPNIIYLHARVRRSTEHIYLQGKQLQFHCNRGLPSL